MLTLLTTAACDRWRSCRPRTSSCLTKDATPLARVSAIADGYVAHLGAEGTSSPEAEAEEISKKKNSKRLRGCGPKMHVRACLHANARRAHGGFAGRARGAGTNSRPSPQPPSIYFQQLFGACRRRSIESGGVAPMGPRHPPSACSREGKRAQGTKQLVPVHGTKRR